MTFLDLIPHPCWRIADPSGRSRRARSCFDEDVEWSAAEHPAERRDVEVTSSARSSFLKGSKLVEFSPALQMNLRGNAPIRLLSLFCFRRWPFRPFLGVRDDIFSVVGGTLVVEAAEYSSGCFFLFFLPFPFPFRFLGFSAILAISSLSWN